MIVGPRCRRAARALAAGALLGWLMLAAAVAAPLAGVAVWDFENQTPAIAARTGAEPSDWLARALSENLIAALLEVPGLAVVERQQLKDVLAEQRLAGGELADDDSRLKLGRIVGAGRMVFGGYFVLGNRVQVNVRVVETATSRVVYADEINAPLGDVMVEAAGLTQRITRHLGGGAVAGKAYPATLWQAYDRALALSDAGRWEQAAAALQQLLAQSGIAFVPAERQLQVVLEKMSRR